VGRCGHADWCFEEVDGERVCRECERIASLEVQYGDRLMALERRGDEMERFATQLAQARKWIAEHGTESLVEELREAQRQKRQMKLGTINVLVLLAHIDCLDAEVAKPTLVKS
jgi:hypothetical protein